MTTAHVLGSGVLTLDGAGVADVGLIGTKAHALAHLHVGPFDVPPGFIVTTSAYEQAINVAGIADRLERLWRAAEQADSSEVARIAREARRLIHGLEIEPSTRQAITDAYQQLSDQQLSDQQLSSQELGTDASVAVRSSPTPDGVSGVECAGIHATYTSVIGPDAVTARIRSCWASLFGERALTMRARGLGTSVPSMAVVVQSMIRADRSGILTPVNGTGEFLVEATFGLGEPIVSGAVSPDRYVVDRDMAAEIAVTIGRKEIALVVGDDGDFHVFLPEERQTERVLTDGDLRRLARLSAAIDHHFGSPQEIEWAAVGDAFYVLQARPIARHLRFIDEVSDRVLTGIGVGRGVATGHVRRARTIDAAEQIKDGDVLVVEATSPAWVPFISRASAVIADLGDHHCHAATICRELGIPAVVGTERALTELEPGRLVTVDADRGWILRAEGP